MSTEKYILKQFILNGKTAPFNEWLNKLEKKDADRIRARLYRFEFGNFGDFKKLSKGVFEARMFFGKGYRVYFGLDNNELVLLLLGGDKKTQNWDIQKAKIYWKRYLEAKDVCKKLG